RDRIKPAVDLRQNTVFVEAPVREPAQIFKDALRIGVEDVRSVRMDEHAGLIEAIIGISTDMRSPIDQENGLAGGCEAFRADAAGKASADDEIVVDHAAIDFVAGRKTANSEQERAGGCQMSRAE